MILMQDKLQGVKFIGITKPAIKLEVFVENAISKHGTTLFYGFTVKDTLFRFFLGLFSTALDLKTMVGFFFNLLVQKI